MSLTLIWILSGLLFIALLISLGFQPHFMNKLLGFLFLFVGISGLCFYGYGYFSLNEDGLLAVAKTVFWVFCMFLGRNDIGTISKVPFLATTPMQILIYFTHLMALYAAAGALVTNLGARLIRSLNLLLLHHRGIDLIFGVSDASLRFAARLQQQEKKAFVFVDDGGGSILNDRILKMGGILMSDESAKKPTAAFLKKIGIRGGKKEFRLFCLSENLSSNLSYATDMKEALANSGMPSEHCSVSLLTQDGNAGASLQADADGRGFGSVLALEKEELLARLLIREFPPCETMRFDEKGRAAENFEAVIVGFGKTGQAVLRNLIMNGQFAGSCFHAMIVAKDYSRQAGHFYALYSGLMEQYAIDFCEENARSLTVFDYLKKTVDDLNYVVICAGNERENAEIAKEYRDFLREYGSRAKVHQCNHSSIVSFSDPDGQPQSINIYTPDILDGSRLDTLAKQINHQYHLEDGKSAEEDWAACDYFSRQSCRASADYLPAFLTAAGLTEKELMESGWPEDPVLRENLSEMEHLRWCAFHFGMGYRTMPEEEFERRAAIYRREKEESGSAKIRVGKDTSTKRHACLIPWDALRDLDRREKELTGRIVDYQKMDLDNVLLIPSMLRKREKKS